MYRNEKLRVYDEVKGKPRKFRLLLDMDDVISETFEEFLKEYRRRYGMLFMLGNVDYWKFFGDLCGVGIYKQTFDRKDFYKELKPKRDALEWIEKWVKGGEVDVIIVTACVSPKAYEEKLKWFDLHLPFFPKDRIISTREKTAVWGDLLVDDGLHNVTEYSSIGDVLLYDMAHNRQGKDFKRVRCLKDVNDYIEQNYLRRD